MQMAESGELNNQESVHWTVDLEFFALKFPADPKTWSEGHVRFWLKWAKAKFGLRLEEHDWRRMTGSALNELSFDDFQKKVRFDAGNRFWIHFELLRQTHYVSVPCEETSANEGGETVASIENRLVFTLAKIFKKSEYFKFEFCTTFHLNTITFSMIL